MSNPSRVALFLLVLIPGSVLAETGPCTDIDASATNWSTIATWLEELTSAGQLSAQQAEWFDTEIDKNIPYTLGLASRLSQGQSAREKKLGSLLQRSLEQLDRAESFEQIIAAMNSTTSSLARISQHCTTSSPQVAAVAEPTPTPSAPTNETQSEPAAIVTFEQPPAELENLATALRDSGIFHQWADYITAGYRLPRQLPIHFTTCGEPNAFYSSEGLVTVCYELLALASNLFLELGYEAEETYSAVLGAGTFFLLHELGHAFVDQMQLPITGREEDAVDGLATLILLNSGNHEAVLSTVEYWDSLARLGAQAGAELAFWDEHSLDEQRVYDLACLVYGSDPETYAGLASDDYIPLERAVQCPAEFERKFRSWNQLLEPHVRLE